MTEQEPRNPFKDDEDKQDAENVKPKVTIAEENKIHHGSVTDDNGTLLKWSEEMKTEFTAVQSPGIKNAKPSKEKLDLPELKSDHDEQRHVKSQEFDLKNPSNGSGKNVLSPKNMDGQLKSEIDLRQLNNMSPTSAPNDLPESVRDLDLTRPGFKQAAMNLEDNQFSKLIKRDDLKCRTEDDVLMLIIEYIKKLTAKTFEDARQRYLPNVRLDQLSS